MKQLWLSTLAVCGLLWTLLPAPAAQAQQTKPIVVVSCTKLQDLLDDAAHLAQVAQVGPQATAFLTALPDMMKGVDLNRPSGMVVSTREGQPAIVGFIPVTDLDQVLNQIADRLRTTVDDAQPGIKRVGPVLVKEQDGYAYLSNKADYLSELPAVDRALNGLEKQHDMAVRINFQNIPPLLKLLAMGTIRQGLDDSMKQNPGESDAQFEIRKQLSQSQLDLIQEVFDQLETVTIGTTIDRTAGTTQLEYSITVKSGSSLAEEMADVYKTSSRFTSVIQPDAMFYMHAANEIKSAAAKERGMTQIKGLRKAMESLVKESKEIESEEDRALALDLVTEGFDLLEESQQTGKGDLGLLANQNAGEPPFAVFGCSVPDGKKYEAFVKKVLTVLQDKVDDFPDVEYNVATHRGASIHAIALPEAKDEEVTNIFGEEITLYVAFGKDSMWMAIGSECEEQLKGLIDRSSGAAPVPVRSMEMSMALRPALRMVGQAEGKEALTKVANQLEPGTDRVRMTGEAIDNGIRMRIQVGDGIIRGIALIVKSKERGDFDN